MNRLFSGGSLDVVVTSDSVHMTFKGQVEAKDLSSALVDWSVRRCYMPGLWVLDIAGASWRARDASVLEQLRPCSVLGGGECPGIYVIVVNSSQRDWYSRWALDRAGVGAVVGLFTSEIEARAWGLDRLRAVTEQRTRLWSSLKARGQAAVCPVARLPMLGRKPCLDAPDLQWSPTVYQGLRPLGTGVSSESPGE